MNVGPYMNQTVTIAPATGVTTYGEPTYGGGVSYKCRIQPKIQIVRKAKDGTEAHSTHVIYLQSPVGLEDLVTLPGESFGRMPLNVFTEVDLDGVTSFYKVVL